MARVFWLKVVLSIGISGSALRYFLFWIYLIKSDITVYQGLKIIKYMFYDLWNNLTIQRYVVITARHKEIQLQLQINQIKH